MHYVNFRLRYEIYFPLPTWLPHDKGQCCVKHDFNFNIVFFPSQITLPISLNFLEKSLETLHYQENIPEISSTEKVGGSFIVTYRYNLFETQCKLHGHQSRTNGKWCAFAQLFYLFSCLPAFVIVECLFAPTHPTLSCLYRVWVGKYFHQFICVTVNGGCCSQGSHGTCTLGLHHARLHITQGTFPKLIYCIEFNRKNGT